MSTPVQGLTANGVYVDVQVDSKGRLVTAPAAGSSSTGSTATLTISQVSVGTAATALTAAVPSATRQSVKIHVPTGGTQIFVGPTGVTTATGFPVAPGETLELPLSASAPRLYGIIAAGTQATGVAEIG